MFNLLNVKNKKVKKFSSGMLQRVGIIGAILNEPKILLLDEPFSGLDPSERNNLKYVLSELERKTCIILSTHITGDIEFLANNITMIKDKKILFLMVSIFIIQFIAFFENYKPRSNNITNIKEYTKIANENQGAINYEIIDNNILSNLLTYYDEDGSGHFKEPTDPYKAWLLEYHMAAMRNNFKNEQIQNLKTIIKNNPSLTDTLNNEIKQLENIGNIGYSNSKGINLFTLNILSSPSALFISIIILVAIIYQNYIEKKIICKIYYKLHI